MQRLAVRRVGLGDRFIVIPLSDVSFLFLGSAVTCGLIDSSWVAGRCPDPGAVYVRSARGLFRSGVTRLEALRQRLDPDRFLSVHRCLIVSLDYLVELDFGRGVSRVGMAAGNEVEYLTVSRRRLRVLREAVGLPRRLARVPG
jgi:hypothetical protein